jgi:hypothetical protein
MQLTDEDIKKAQEILRRWRVNAAAKGNEDAKKDVEHIMRVLNALYGGNR